MSTRTTELRSVLRLAIAVAIGIGLSHSVTAAAQQTQRTFASPEESVDAFATAARTRDQAQLHAILGPDGDKMLSSGDRYADDEALRRFAAAYDDKHTLVPKDPGHMELDVGNDNWPLPIPVVQENGRWQFDTRAGAQEIIDRRIGRNELAAIYVALTYVDAQKDYFARMKQQAGTGFYAERLISTPGHEDGLYWPANAGSAASPFEALVAEAEDDGYAGAFRSTQQIPYMGYSFRILKAEGENSSNGPMNYVKSGRMTEGFALLAWPASYRSSGIMTFEIGPDGILFQKDLGPSTGRLAPAITTYDPDLSWARVEVTDR